MHDGDTWKIKRTLYSSSALIELYSWKLRGYLLGSREQRQGFMYRDRLQVEHNTGQKTRKKIYESIITYDSKIGCESYSSPVLSIGAFAW